MRWLILLLIAVAAVLVTYAVRSRATISQGGAMQGEQIEGAVAVVSPTQAYECVTNTAGPSPTATIPVGPTATTTATRTAHLVCMTNTTGPSPTNTVPPAATATATVIGPPPTAHLECATNTAGPSPTATAAPGTATATRTPHLQCITNTAGINTPTATRTSTATFTITQTPTPTAPDHCSQASNLVLVDAGDQFRALWDLIEPPTFDEMVLVCNSAPLLPRWPRSEWTPETVPTPTPDLGALGWFSHLAPGATPGDACLLYACLYTQTPTLPPVSTATATPVIPPPSTATATRTWTHTETVTATFTRTATATWTPTPSPVCAPGETPLMIPIATTNDDAWAYVVPDFVRTNQTCGGVILGGPNVSVGQFWGVSGGFNNIVGLLRFNTGAAIPPNRVVTSAVLRITMGGNDILGPSPETRTFVTRYETDPGTFTCADWTLDPTGTDAITPIALNLLPAANGTLRVPMLNTGQIALAGAGYTALRMWGSGAPPLPVVGALYDWQWLSVDDVSGRAPALELCLAVPTPTAPPTQTGTVTQTPIVTATPVNTNTHTVGPSPTATATGSATATAISTPTATATPVNTNTVTAGPSPTNTVTGTATATVTATATSSHTSTPVSTATITLTPSNTATRTLTPTRTATRTGTITPQTPIVPIAPHITPPVGPEIGITPPVP